MLAYPSTQEVHFKICLYGTNAQAPLALNKAIIQALQAAGQEGATSWVHALKADANGQKINVSIVLDTKAMDDPAADSAGFFIVITGTLAYFGMQGEGCYLMHQQAVVAFADSLCPLLDVSPRTTEFTTNFNAGQATLV